MDKTYKILKLTIYVLIFAVLMVGAYTLYNRLSGQVQMDALATEATQAQVSAAAKNQITCFRYFQIRCVFSTRESFKFSSISPS